MPHYSTSKSCTLLILILSLSIVFAPQQSEGYTNQYFTAYYSQSYNNYQYYYSLYSLYGYPYNTYVLGYAYPYWYLYRAGYSADYYTRLAALYHKGAARSYVTNYASYYDEVNAGIADNYWNLY